MTRFKIALVFCLCLLCIEVFPWGKKQFTVAVNMLPDQKEYFTNKIISNFNKQNKCGIEVIDFKDNSKIPDFFTDLPAKSDGGKPSPLGLIMIPHEMTMTLIKSGKLKPFNGFLDENTMKEIKDTYFLVEMYEVEGNLYLIPRKLETRIMAYRKSKVEDAVKNWSTMKEEINTLLKSVNNFGLPKEYKLEVSPGLWDFYDMFVVGYYWANEPGNKDKAGRLSHRGKRYHGTVTGLMDKIFQCGGTEYDILDLERKPGCDAFAWECLMIKHGLYNPGMWEQGWSGTDIWQAFKDNQTYLAFMTQIDCFFLLGGEKGKDPFVIPDELGISIVPKGGSIDLDKDGNALRSGRYAVSTGGWWWAVPAKAKYPDLAYRLIDYISSLEVHKEECGKFGTIPVRMEMIVNSEDYFEKKTTQEIYKVSKYQLTNNSINSVPLVKNYNLLEEIYLDVWYNFCIKEFYKKDTLVSTDLIGKAITTEFGKRLKEIK
ncbi:MAG: extracellular solute-binding protein [bacterium]